MEIALTALVAGLLGALGPLVIRRLREPLPDDRPEDGVEGPDAVAEPEPPKELYADLGRARGLGAWLAVTSAAMGAAVAASIDLTELLPVWALLCGVGSWLSFIDWRTRLLPFDIVAPLYLVTLALVGLAALLADDRWVLFDALIANAAVFAFLWILNAVGGLGYGDVRLGGVIALALGPLGYGAVVLGLWVAFGLGGVGGLILARLGVVDRSSFALGPYLVAGAVVGAVWGPHLFA